MNYNEKYEEKELAILRAAVDKAENNAKRESVNSPEITRIINITELFLRKTKCICYGGTAINNILPINDQFYDKSLEIPDYDFYSSNALKHAKQLADIYAKEGFTEIEAKAGVHHGTYKVFVNYIPVADITQMEKKLFSTIKRDSILVNGILYAPPNFLRMAMYLELSRPKGDVSRWEKVQKRLVLLNKNYPLKYKICSYDDFQRSFENTSRHKKDENKIYKIVKESLINQGVVFFGGYATNLFSKYMPKKFKKHISDIPDFDVLSETPKTTATILQERLLYEGYKKVKIVKKKGIGEIIATHYEILVDNETVAFIYEPLACHSYNIIHIKGQPIKVATIDTMLSFYLAFIYADRPYYDTERILCMAQYLFQVQYKNRLQQKGLLKRFSIKCYGNQTTLTTIREEKAEMYKKLKDDKHSNKYEEWFLNYNPLKNISSKSESSKSESSKTKKTRKKKLRKKQKKRTFKNIKSDYIF